MGKYKVLSTRKLESPLVQKANKNDIEIIEQEFISVKPNLNEEVLNKILEIAKKKKAYIAFTSANAVDALSNYRAAYERYSVNWNIFCLSGRTKRAIQGVDILKKNIVDEAKDASELAQKIIQSGVDEIIFFCGNKRRDELPTILESAKIKVRELVLYETSETAKEVDDDFDAILFFSPSGVQSFFSVNELADNTICFAIGATTATRIATFANNEIVISPKPSPEAMLEQLIQHFEEKSAVD